MKRFMLAGAAIAALVSAPAVAQQVSAPQADAPATTGAASSETPLAGQVTVDGVAPAQALGAIDPTKLAGSDPEIAAPEGGAPTANADTTTSAEGNVTVQGVAPSQALGAIDPSKLADNTQAAEQAQVAEAPSQTDNTAGLVQVAEVDVPLPSEVAEVVEDGAYSTEDLVAAQLAAIMDRDDQTAEAEPAPGSEPVVTPG